MSKMTEMFAFVATEKNGDEGLIAAQTEDGSWMPLVGSDLARVHSLIPVAEGIKQATGVDYRVLHFQLVGEVPTTSQKVH